MRACWCRPTPGSPMKEGYEEAEMWPEAIPATAGATNRKEKKLVDVALGNFVLVLIEPTFADWIQLGTVPDPRTFYRGEDRDHRRALKHALYPWWYEHLYYRSTCVMREILLFRVLDIPRSEIRYRRNDR
jgi:hypothetical protein